VQSRLVVFILTVAGASACSHTVKIDSTPPGATIFIDGEDKGKAPVTLEETNGFFNERKVRVELEGYAPLETTVVQAEPVWPIVAASVCGAPLTFGLSCLGLRYATKYGESYEYRLSPLGADGELPPPVGQDAPQIDPDATYPF
jgi:hypothetical protein